MIISRVRPTIRCLVEDLTVDKPPPVDDALGEIDHVVLRKANAQFAIAEARGERIAAVDDTVLFKVKIPRWRAAVWRPFPEQWLVAAGRREAGSPEDFYVELAERGRRWRAERNRTAATALTTDTRRVHAAANRSRPHEACPRAGPRKRSGPMRRWCHD